MIWTLAGAARLGVRAAELPLFCSTPGSNILFPCLLDPVSRRGKAVAALPHSKARTFRPRITRSQNLQQPSLFEVTHTLALIVLAAEFGGVVRAQTQSAARARITIDARKVENRISPTFYGQFMEFMYEGVKGGLYAELLRDRSFEEPANPIGLPRDWERDPDDRNDDTAIKFHWEDSLSYPPPRSFDRQTIEHSLRITITENDGQRRGIYQSGIPIREGVEYRGYLWVRSPEFEGHATAALEKDQTGGEVYALQDMPHREGRMAEVRVHLKTVPERSIGQTGAALLWPWARLG